MAINITMCDNISGASLPINYSITYISTLKPENALTLKLETLFYYLLLIINNKIQIIRY